MVQNPINKQVNKPLVLAKPRAGWDWELEHPTGNEQLPQSRHEGLPWRLRLTKCNPKFNPAKIKMVVVSIQVEW